MPRIVVDANGMLVLANRRARTLFSINPRDIGRPLSELEISYRPVELRSLMEQAYAERRRITQTSVERRFADGQPQYFDVVLTPVLDRDGTALGIGVTFVEVTRALRLQEDLRESREEVQTATEELQSANEEPDLGLPVSELRSLARPCLAGEVDHNEIVLAAVNRRGKSIQCRVFCTPLLGADRKKREGVILLMEPQEA